MANLSDNQTTRQDTQGVTVKEAARFFGVSTETIRQWCKRGKLPSVLRPSGRIWHIPSWALRVTERGEGVA